ncbi:MAG: hypothetical protein JWN43_282 [Gammaproteobacteria bacterium]|nr:hypothetical protein [Gammaproteobacteria bacterium]
MRSVLLALALACAGALCAGAAHAAEGAAVFAHNCALCHQADASGLPGQFPRLAGRIGHISGKAPGRAYLIDVLTYGMAGEVTVDKQTIVGVMPPLQLSDDDTAQVLSFLTALGHAGPTPFTADEVAAQRAKPRKSGADVHAERQSLLASKVVE